MGKKKNGAEWRARINRSYYQLCDAERHYLRTLKKDHGCSVFLIEDHENDIFSVVSEGMLEYLKNDRKLRMTIKETKKGKPLVYNFDLKKNTRYYQFCYNKNIGMAKKQMFYGWREEINKANKSNSPRTHKKTLK